MKRKNLMDDVVKIILALFGIFIAYQILRIITGGSWQTESIIIALLIFNLGISWRLNAKLEGHRGWHKGKDSK